MGEGPVPPTTAAPPVSEADARSLARYLLSFRWPDQNAEVERELVENGLPLWRQILRFVPSAHERRSALELGSPPFHITLLLRRLRNYELSLAGCATDGRPEIRQELESTEYQERQSFACLCFDVERDPFPYANASFDLVTWCEVIEHLTENPVHTLGEIHRVLRPGGYLVISTPNASRASNIVNLLRGGNVYDPYHLGAPLKGSRHSREYTLAELRALVAGCGFSIDRAEDIDINPPAKASQAAFRWLMNGVIARVTGGRHRAHLFVRARKTEAPFRRYFPEALFDCGQLAFHMAPQSTSVVMGENDQEHTALGWGALRTGPGGKAARRCGDVGDIYLSDRGSALRRVSLTVSDGRGEAQAWHDGAGGAVLLGSTRFDAPAGEWREVLIPLSNESQRTTPLHVRLQVPGGVDVHAATVD